MTVTPPEYRYRQIPVNYTMQSDMGQRSLGLVQHVAVGGNVSLYGWFSNPSAMASSTWWVGWNSGEREQYVDPDHMRAWAQGDGNSTYHSIETAGDPENPLTDAQVEAEADLYAWGHARYGWPFRLAEHPGEPGFGWHGMGGAAWGGHDQCLPLDITEALTPRGWVPLSEVTPTTEVASYAVDSGLLTFDRPVRIVEPYPARTVRLGGIEMTPDHRLYVHRSDHPTQKVMTAREVGAVRTNYLAPAFGQLALSPGVGAGPDLMRFLTWVQADGHLERDRNGRTYSLQFHFSKQRKIDRVLQLLERLGQDRHSVVPRKDGTTVIRVYGGEWIRDNVLRYLPEKRWTWDLLDASPQEFAALDEEITQADGSERPDMRTYSTSVKENADIIQTLYVTHGRSAAIHPTTGGWVVQLHVSRSAHALRDTYAEARDETLVGCLTTVNDTILVRQNGRVMVVGNCPGDLRKAQRNDVLRLAEKITDPTTGQGGLFGMSEFSRWSRCQVTAREGRWTTVPLDDEGSISVAIGTGLTQALAVVSAPLPAGATLQARFYEVDYKKGETTQRAGNARPALELSSTGGSTFGTVNYLEKVGNPPAGWSRRVRLEVQSFGADNVPAVIDVRVVKE